MSKLKTHVQIHNKYELELYDVEGNLKDKAYAYNVVTNYFWNRFFNAQSLNWFRYIGIGTGTGTPSASDNSLFRHLAYVDTELVSKKIEYPTSTYVRKGIFGASTSLKGLLTEVGFVDAGSSCLTHAMLQDAEGNTITINKTDADVLIVTATLYVTVTADESFLLVPANDFGLFNTIGGSGYGFSATVGHLHASAGVYLPVLGSLHSRSAGNASGSPATRSATLGAGRMPVDSGQRFGIGTYVNSLFIANFGGIRLPDPQIFPEYRLSPMNVGTGDGVTTEFVCPIPDFVEGTEKVVVDGVVLTNGVDYTVDSKGNSALNASSINAHSNFAVHISNGGKDGYNATRMFGTAGFATTQAHGIFAKGTAPLVFDMGKDVECNALFVDGLVCRYNTSNTMPTTLVLEYSANKSDWEEAARITLDARGTAYEGKITGANKNQLVRFEGVTARYWRLHVESDNSHVKNYGIGSAWGNSFFGKVGQGIVFTNPPAEGAIITIDAIVDRPYKTADYVLDYSASMYW